MRAAAAIAGVVIMTIVLTKIVADGKQLLVVVELKQQQLLQLQRLR